MNHKHIIAALLLVGMHSFASAQIPVSNLAEGTKLRIGGSLQTRASFLSNPNLAGLPESQMGVGIRRARIRLFADPHPNVRLFLQVEGSAASTTFTDMRAEWDITKKTTLRMGRFVGAQPRGMALTLMYDIDAIDRAAIMEHWARSTYGSNSRDFGVEVVHQKGDVELRGFLHNGDSAQNFRPSSSETSANGGPNRGAMATSAMVRLLPSSLPHSDFGAHVGYNPTKMPNSLNREYMEWSSHAYWGDKIGTQPTRLKLDVVGIRYLNAGAIQRNTLGVSLLAAQLIRPDTEIFARVERLDTTLDEYAYVTVGTTQKLWNWTNKVTAAWTMRTDLATNSDPVHILAVQTQFNF
jgi:hypothetical protein